MLDKLFRKMDQLKEEVFDQADKHIGNVTREMRNGVGEKLNSSVSDIFSSIANKAGGSLLGAGDYLMQVGKVAQEKTAKELGISSRELMGLSMEEIAGKYGMTLDEYQEKLKKEAEAQKENSILGGASEIAERSKKEAEARKIQAGIAGMSEEDFNELTLQEQADKLGMSLEVLLEQRHLNF